MKTVCIESPLKGDIERNVAYARAALVYCLEQGVSPYASHLWLTQVYDDLSPEQREVGIDAGLAMGDQCDERWYFLDFGQSVGMTRARCRVRGQKFVEIQLGRDWADRYRATPTPGFLSADSPKMRPMSDAPKGGERIIFLTEMVGWWSAELKTWWTECTEMPTQQPVGWISLESERDEETS